MGGEAIAAVVGGVCGLVAGLTGSLVAPWVNWRIEERRAVRAERAERVRDWRAGLAEAERGDQIEGRQFLHTDWYNSLRPHLDHEALRMLETTPRWSARLVDGVEHRHHLADLLASEMDRVSRDWEVY